MWSGLQKLGFQELSSIVLELMKEMAAAALVIVGLLAGPFGIALVWPGLSSVLMQRRIGEGRSMEANDEKLVDATAEPAFFLALCRKLPHCAPVPVRSHALARLEGTMLYFDYCLLEAR